MHTYRLVSLVQATYIDRYTATDWVSFIQKASCINCFFFLFWNINMYIVRYLTYTHILNVILYNTFNNFVLETKFHEATISACGFIAIV